MLLEKKDLKYKGRIIFEKIKMARFDRAPKHFQNNEACFIFLDGGNFTLRSSSTVFTLNPNSALLSQCYNYFFELEDDADQAIDILEAIGVMLHPEIISELFDIKLLAVPSFQQSHMQTINIDPLLETFKESINYLIDNPALSDENLIELKLREFVQLMMRQRQNESIQHFFSTLFNPIIYNIEQTIANNLNVSLSIKELAFLTNMSVSTFKRRFREIYKESPHKYLLKKKIEKACEQLNNKEVSISQVAFNCGFDGISTFNRNFKNQTGMSPTQWKEQIVY